MAGAGGRADADLKRRLQGEPHRFDFFQAVRLLLLWARAEAGEARPGLGDDTLPESEPVRIAAHAALAFPSASMDRIDGNGESVPKLLVNFMGLTGPVGVLPPHYTDTVIRAERAKQDSLADFLDLFNHRLTSLFWRAWAKYRLPVAYELAPSLGGDAATRGLTALVGFGWDATHEAHVVPDETFVHYAGHMAHWPRSAAALEAMLSDYFGTDVRVEQFHGRWMAIEVADRSRLAGEHDAHAAYCALGVNATIGERVFDVQGGFRLHLGPMGYADFRHFMPDGSELPALEQLTRLFAGPGFLFDVQVVLRRDEVPALELAAGSDAPPRLGWNTWLKTKPFMQDAADAIFVFH
jgi:type VI secretion system protein ImpH